MSDETVPVEGHSARGWLGVLPRHITCSPELLRGFASLLMGFGSVCLSSHEIARAALGLSLSAVKLFHLTANLAAVSSAELRRTFLRFSTWPCRAREHK